jgi:hypothetical protein
MKTDLRNVFTSLSLFALALFMGNGFLVGQAQAQTASTTTNQQGQSEFKNDVEQGIQEVNNDRDAQNNQHEIDNADNENAGDEHGGVNEMDGENNQNEIDIQINQEIGQENSTGNGASSDAGTGNNE